MRWVGIYKTCQARGDYLAGFRLALIGTGWTTSHPVSTNRWVKITPLHLKSGTVGSFWSGEALFGQRAICIESSLEHGCHQGH